MQVPHDVLDAHEEVLDTQYDDDDIGYAVPELCSRCNRQASSKQQASKQLFCNGGRECCWRELVLVLHSYILSKSTNLLSWGTQGYLKSVTLPVVLITIPFQSQCCDDVAPEAVWCSV